MQFIMIRQSSNLKQTIPYELQKILIILVLG